MTSTEQTPTPRLSTSTDQPLTADAAVSFTLPSRFYTSPDLYRNEKSAIFEQSWFYVGHRSQLRETGAYLTATVFDQEVFVARDDDGTLNGFYNVCKHRGHELVQGVGTAKKFTCPYHAWVYALDGSLRHARNTSEMQAFDACDFALSPIQVDEMCGFVFVNLDPDAAPLAEQAQGLEADIRRYCPEIDRIEFAQRDTFDAACNWKTLIDNFLECYHCATAHRDFVDLVDMDSYSTTVFDTWSSQISQAARTTDSSAYSFTPGEVDFGYASWFVWPNLTIWIYPGDTNVSILQMLPSGPEQTIEYQDWFCLGGKPTEQLREAMVYQKDVLQPEDIGLCESVQKGLRSNGYDQGRFVIDNSLSELSEHAVHHFQRLVAAAHGLPIS